MARSSKGVVCLLSKSPHVSRLRNHWQLKIAVCVGLSFDTEAANRPSDRAISVIGLYLTTCLRLFESPVFAAYFHTLCSWLAMLQSTSLSAHYHYHLSMNCSVPGSLHMSYVQK